MGGSMDKRSKIYCKFYGFPKGNCEKTGEDLTGYVLKCPLKGDYTRCKSGEPEEVKQEPKF